MPNPLDALKHRKCGDRKSKGPGNPLEQETVNPKDPARGRAKSKASVTQYESQITAHQLLTKTHISAHLLVKDAKPAGCFETP